MTRRTAFALLLLAVTATGCLDSFRKHPETSGGNPGEVSYAPALGVHLKAMRQTADGLYIQDLTEGEGPAAAPGDRVSVRYTGWLPDGRKFDSTGEGGAPFSFLLGRGQVIQGWDEGVAGMKPGGARLLVIPPSLGYGAQGMGTIPPNSTLVFRVEAVAVDRNQ